MTASPPASSSSDRSRRIALFLIVIFLRALYLYAIRHNPFFDSPIIDAQTYDEKAQAIASGVWTDHEAFWQPPLYPYLLGFLYRIVGHSLAWARLCQVLLSALLCVLASELAARRFGPRVAWWTGLLLALYGPLFFYTGELLVPALSLPLDAAMLLALSPPAGRTLTYRRLALAGLLLGLSAAARPTILLFLPCAVLYLIQPARGGTWRRRGLQVATLSALTCLPILPITLHNVLLGHEPVLISTNGGINFYIGNNAHYDEMVGIRPGLGWNTLIAEPDLHGAKSGAEASSYWMKKGWDFILAHPIDALLLQLKKTWLLFQAYELPRNVDFNFFARHYAKYLLFSVQFGAVLPLALVGMWLSRKEPDQGVWRLFLLSNAVSIVAFFIAERYRLTLVPVLSIYAALSLETFRSSLRSRMLRPLLAPALAVAGLALLFQADPFHVARIDEAEGYNLVGKARSNAGRHDAAVKAFQKALTFSPGYTDVKFNLGRELQIQHRCEEAITYYQATLLDYPRERETLNNLAVCYLEKGRLNEGIALLEQMLSFYPDVAAIYYNLSQAYMKAGRPGDARHTLEDGIKRFPGTDFLIAAQKDLDQALEQRSRMNAGLSGSRSQGASSASSVDNPIPELAKQLNNEAHRLLVGGDVAGATTRLLEALRLAPSYATAWSNLGQAYYLSNQFLEARKAFEKAIELNPQYWKARVGLALTLANGLKDIPEARAALTAVVENAPEAESAQARELRESLPGP